MHSGALTILPKPDLSIESALRTVAFARNGVEALAASLDTGLADPFARVVDLVSQITGRVIVTGVGKSGHIGSKIAATLASTGTPAFFVHAAEANHGDLGMIARDDAILAISWSGETYELKGIISYSRRFSIPLIALTSGPNSALARAADVVLCLPKSPEACPHGLAPTVSTMLQLIIGDALAIALLEARGFTPDHFRTFHPGGQLGAGLMRIREIMHREDAVPVVTIGTPMRDAIEVISAKKLGCVVVVNHDGRVAGIITDGDLRRKIADGLLTKTVEDVMVKSPKTIGPDELAASALRMIETMAITGLAVVEHGRLAGFVHLHDLLKIGVA